MNSRATDWFAALVSIALFTIAGCGYATGLTAPEGANPLFCR